MKKHEDTTPPVGSSLDADQAIDGFTQGFVRKRVWQVIGKFGFKPQDSEDIEQQLFVKLAKHLPAKTPQDPKWKAFVAKTVKRHIATMIRDRRAEKRDHRRVSSIHVIIGRDDDCPIELADTISEDDGHAHCGISSRSEQEFVELVEDLAACIAGLPDERLREFCERLKHDSISQVARDMGIPRTTLNAWLTRIRCRFEDRGLREYL